MSRTCNWSICNIWGRGMWMLRVGLTNNDLHSDRQHVPPNMRIKNRTIIRVLSAWGSSVTPQIRPHAQKAHRAPPVSRANGLPVRGLHARVPPFEAAASYLFCSSLVMGTSSSGGSVDKNASSSCVSRITYHGQGVNNYH